MNEGSTYYIDPGTGDDTHPGTDHATPWATFFPLSKLRFGPGDRVEILSPGAFEDSLVLTGEGTVEAPITVNFAPGRYDFFPTHAKREIFNISNCNDDVVNPKAIGLLIKNARHIVLSGPGATIVFRGKMIEVCIDHSEAVRVEQLRFDYHRPTVSEFAVSAIAEDYADIDVHPDSHYTVVDGKICWLGEGWSYDTGLAQELIPETERVWRRKDPLEGLRVEELAPGKLRAHGARDMIAGRIFQLRNPYRDCCGVFMRRSKDVTLREVDFFFMHGMGILCQFTENITLDSVRIAPEEGSGRTTAAWADCTHFSGCRGKITMKHCLFCGAHDDAVNVHGTHLRIMEQTGDRQVTVRFMHRQTFGFMAFKPGDEIDFVRWDSLASFAVNRVITAKLINPHEMMLTLQDPVPGDWRENDVIENVTWTPAVEISNCTAKRISTRGFLLTTRRTVDVRNNTFIRLRIGVHVESDAEGWFESGCVRDMTIQNNRFVACARAAVCISPHTSKPNPSAHSNIRIVDNEVTVPDTAVAIEASGVSGLTVSGNRIEAPGRTAEDLFAINDCTHVQFFCRMRTEKSFCRP